MSDEIVIAEEQETKRRNRAIYILPNLFTSAVLFCGFYAIVQAMNGFFEQAVIAVFVAMVLDGLDGRVARLTNTQSQFGAEYDSLADMVAFGAAPALVMYEWALRDLGKLGWVAAFIHCVSTGLRLARFNTNIAVIDKRFFQGLPSPSAAALVAGFIWLMLDLGVAPASIKYLACVVPVFSGLSMVSNVFFWSGKDINLRRAVPFFMAVLFVAGLLAVSSYPSGMLFGLALIYSLSGYFMTVLRWLRKRRTVPVVKN